QGQVRWADQQRRELAKQLQAARAELQKIQQKGQSVTATVAIDLRVEKPGSFQLEATYVVPSASWHPIWDAHLDPQRQVVDLGFFASVQQSSGEDWSDVKLAVSTAQPNRGLYVPELQAQFLSKPRPQMRPEPTSAPPPSMPSAAIRGGARRKAEAM